MKTKIPVRILAAVFAIILTLSASVLPALAVEHDPYLNMEYDYSEKGTIEVEVGKKLYYGGYYPISNYNECTFFRINGNTAQCCWTNMNSPVSSKDTGTKYFIGNHSNRAKAFYYFLFADGNTPTARNEKIAGGMPTKFLGKTITYYKDYVQAAVEYAKNPPAGQAIDGERNYKEYSDDDMAYLVSHLTMDDMMNFGNGIRIADGSHPLSPYSPLVYAVEKLVDDILYNSSVMSNVPSLPSNIRVFYCFPDRENGRSMKTQGLMSIEAIPNGGFAIQKESANADITEGNDCYSLKDAEFTVYSDKDATEKVTTVTTNEKGYAEVTDLKEGVYYVKETKAPKGYMLNTKVFSVTVKSGDKPSANVLKVAEQPGNDPAVITIFKNDPEHIEKDESGKDVKKGLAGVQFELSYYDADPAVTLALKDLSDREPTRTWILESDARGAVVIGDKWKVRGDDFYYPTADSVIPCVPVGCLTLREIKAADGYVLDPTVRFARVTESMAENHELIKFSDTALTNDSIDYPNRKTTTEISKKSVTDQSETPGAHLNVKDKDGNVLYDWISTEEPYIIRGLNVGETYTLTETLSPDGYSTTSSIDFTVLGDGKVTKVTMYDDVTKYQFIKVDGDGAPLKDVDLRVEEVSDKADKFVEEWTTDGKAHEIFGKLVVGKTYRFIEVKALKGYPIAEPITFTVTDDSDLHTFTMENFITETYISKKSITTMEELVGAHLNVKDKAGNVLHDWISGEKEYLIKGLNPGETYTLTETIAPDGYIVTSTIEFTVNADGSATYVEMVDDITKFKFIKVDEDGKPVEGAVLRIEEFKGMSEAEVTATADEAAPASEIWEPVSGEEWTTDKDGTPHEVNGKFIVGKRYRLVEVTAPKGYNLAAPVEFTVENTAEPIEIKMVNTTTKVTKTDITGEKEVTGAKLIVRDKDGNIVHEFVSGEEPHFVEGLIEGETYTLEEIIPAPGYVTAAPIVFTVTKDGVSTDVTMKDAPTKIIIRKLDDNNKPVAGVKLQILDKDKKVIEEIVTDGKDHLIEAKLVVGETYTLHEVSAPEGYELAKDIEFTVKDTADEQIVTMIDVYKGGSKISTPDQPTKTTNSQNSGSQVKTGQSTIGLMIALAVMVFAAAAIMSYRKKKTNEI